MLDRVPCKVCSNDIVVHASQPHDWICKECRPLCPDERTAKSAFHQTLNNGEAFSPPTVLGIGPKLLSSQSKWQIQPNWFSGSIIEIDAVLEFTQSEEESDLLFNSASGEQFRFVSNELYAACQYLASNDVTLVFAHTIHNIGQQVRKEHQLGLTCPCCGIVNGGYLPSRVHLPKPLGIEVANHVLMGHTSRFSVRWCPEFNLRWVLAGCG